jgi:pyridoxamine 5'-phosphate oxidase
VRRTLGGGGRGSQSKEHPERAAAIYAPVDLPFDPFERFAALYEQARAAIPVDPNAMVVATVGPDGQPSARVVLLKDFDARGFVFYTNYESRKGQELAANPRASLVFPWHAIHRQVCVTGDVERTSAQQSDAYFASRPRDSQIGAWASPQSTELASRDVLEQRFREFAARYDGVDAIPRPPHWGGFRVVPDTVDFWHGRPSRLHDRFRYRPDGSGGWRIVRLAP